MTPFYFGAGERRLFGAYHPAAFADRAPRAAVLCYPGGGEYLNAHRTMRQLAAKLAAGGFHTLRFDYFGTGDSGGDSAADDVEEWSADVETAIGEIRDIAATEKVTLIGLRLGALAAARVAARNARRIEACVLWDPIGSNPAAPPMPELDALLAQYSGRTLLLSTARRAPRMAPRRSSGGQVAPEVSREVVEDVQPWTERSANAGLVPVKAIQRILTWLT